MPPRPAGEGERHARRRRSALQTPSFVDRIDLAEDAVGRVAVFSVEPPPGRPDLPRRRRPPAVARAAGHVLAAIADDPLGAVVLAVALVLVLALGLTLLR